ncbi:hypothetical protein HanPI659440_Chr10g0390721 [Helianthus annuus]|nr:hypothetical protein HanPI659440_Chr10g0390721 [Helianthus annuus]
MTEALYALMELGHNAPELPLAILTYLHHIKRCELQIQFRISNSNPLISSCSYFF